MTSSDECSFIINMPHDNQHTNVVDLQKLWNTILKIGPVGQS